MTVFWLVAGLVFLEPCLGAHLFKSHAVKSQERRTLSPLRRLFAASKGTLAKRAAINKTKTRQRGESEPILMVHWTLRSVHPSTVNFFKSNGDHVFSAVGQPDAVLEDGRDDGMDWGWNAWLPDGNHTHDNHHFWDGGHHDNHTHDDHHFWDGGHHDNHTHDDHHFWDGGHHDDHHFWDGEHHLWDGNHHDNHTHDNHTHDHDNHTHHNHTDSVWDWEEAKDWYKEQSGFGNHHSDDKSDDTHGNDSWWKSTHRNPPDQKNRRGREEQGFFPTAATGESDHHDGGPDGAHHGENQHATILLDEFVWGKMQIHMLFPGVLTSEAKIHSKMIIGGSEQQEVACPICGHPCIFGSGMHEEQTRPCPVEVELLTEEEDLFDDEAVREAVWELFYYGHDMLRLETSVYRYEREELLHLALEIRVAP